MAYSPHSTNLLGRRALVKFFAAIGASTIPGKALGTGLAFTPICFEADAELFARWREYLKFEMELNAAEQARDVVSWNARQSYPPRPESITTDCSATGRRRSPEGVAE